MDIRIGNDIKLNVTLQGQGDLDEKNIKLIEAYLTNTAMEEFLDPSAPFAPVGCCDHICGMRGYHFPVFNSGCPSCCGYHGWPHHYYWHNWIRPFRFDNGVLVPNYGHMFCRHHCHFPKAGHNYSFLAPHKLTGEANKIQVYFPAQKQVAEGDYTLTIVVHAYEYGWGRKDLRTYTMDYGKVFRLTDDENALSGNVEIDVYASGESQPSGDSTKVIPGYIGVVNVTPNGYDYTDQSFESSTGSDMPNGAANVDLTKLTQYENVVGSNTVYTNDASFLWIVTDSPIKSASAGTFDIPLSEAEQYNNKYYYACLNPLAKNKSFKLTIGG